MITIATKEDREAIHNEFHNPDALSSVFAKCKVDMRTLEISQFSIEITVNLYINVISAGFVMVRNISSILLT